MAEEKKICGNCGTPLIIQDGKIICPNCGTEYAIDWGRDDVARAEVETAQARNQALLERDRAITQTREQIAQQQNYDNRRRERERSRQGTVAWLIRTGVIAASLFTIFYLFRACTFLVARNYGSITEAVFGEDASKGNGQTAQTEPVKIDEKMLLGNGEFLKAVYESQIYAVTYLTDREIIPDGTDTKYIYTGNYEYEEGYIVYTSNGRTELFDIFALEYASEEGSESLKVYIPIYVAMTGVREDGQFECDFEAHQYKGTLGKKGFQDKGIILDAYVSAWDVVTETVAFDIPEDIRTEVMENYGKEGTV